MRVALGKNLGGEDKERKKRKKERNGYAQHGSYYKTRRVSRCGEKET